MPVIEKSSVVRVLAETRAKLNLIASHRRWKLSVVVDVLADRYMELEGLALPEPGNRPRKIANATA